MTIEKCRFCHSDEVKVENRKGSSYLSVNCSRCGAIGPVSVNECYAIEWWNEGKKK